MLKYLHHSEHVEKIHEFSLRVRHFAEKEQIPHQVRYDGLLFGCLGLYHYTEKWGLFQLGNLIEKSFGCR